MVRIYNALLKETIIGRKSINKVNQSKERGQKVRYQNIISWLSILASACQSLCSKKNTSAFSWTEEIEHKKRVRNFWDSKLGDSRPAPTSAFTTGVKCYYLCYSNT